MTRLEALAILDNSILTIESCSIDYQDHQDRLLCSVCNESRAGLIKLRAFIWNGLDESDPLRTRTRDL